MRWSYLLFHISFLFSLANCASWKKETLAYMGGGFAVGAGMGAGSAPSGDNKAMHGLLWGSLTSAIIGATLIALKDDDKRLKRKDREIEELNKQIKEKKKLLSLGNSHFLERELPPELESLVEPGKWYLYEIDQWKEIKKGEFVHQDKILQVEPARIKPN